MHLSTPLSNKWGKNTKKFIYKRVYISHYICQYHNQWSRSLFLAVTHRSGQTQVKHETWIHISSNFVAASSFSFKTWFNFFAKVPNRIKDQVTDLSHKDHGPTIYTQIRFGDRQKELEKNERKWKNWNSLIDRIIMEAKRFGIVRIHIYPRMKIR